MGYPMMEAVFGTQMQFNMMMFAIPYQIVIYTYGMYILNPNRQLNVKKLLNPIIISLILGMAAGLLQIKLPAFLLGTLESAKNCMSPSAMILTGFVLAATPIKPIFTDIRLFVGAILRGVIIPLAFLAVMLLLKLPSLYIIVAMVTLSMPMGLNSIVFPEAYGGDSLTGAKSTFMSNVVSIVTIPLMFALLGLICK
jgi:predicted permease